MLLVLVVCFDVDVDMLVVFVCLLEGVLLLLVLCVAGVKVSQALIVVHTGHASGLLSSHHLIQYGCRVCNVPK
jgi:hypothetical protein